MIVRIRGILLGIEEDQALVETGGLTYGVLVSPATAEDLTGSGLVGREIILHTLHYIEGGIGLGGLTPRLVGFSGRTDLDFFQQLISVQGLGIRKALRSMSIPTREYAKAIELNDLVTMKRLPEIGNKTAQKIVMELRGKLALFAHLADGDIVAARNAPPAEGEYQQDAYLVLMQLQYPDAEARELISRVVKNHPEITTSDALVQEIFRSLAGKK